MGGGGGSSSSTQQQTTQNTDMRVVGGDSSTNVSAQAGANVTVTDTGTVHAAFGFANDVMKGAYDTVAQISSSTAQIVQQSEAAVADAYSTAKAGEQKVLVGAALAIVGVVAFAAVK